MAKLLRDTARIQLEVSDYLEAEGAEISEVRLFLNSKTLRLTRQGHSILHKYMGSWSVDLPEKLNTEDLIMLLRTVDAPYYLKKDQIILFSEQDAFMARIAGVKGWIKSK